MKIIGMFIYAITAIVLMIIAVITDNCYSSGIAIIVSLAAAFAALLCFTSIIEEENEKKI